MAQGLNIWVEKRLDGETIRNGVVVHVYAKAEKNRRLVRTIAAPVTRGRDSGEFVELKDGEYQVEAVLPSGELIERQATVRTNATTNVPLRGLASTHEVRSWDWFGGSRRPSQLGMMHIRTGSIRADHDDMAFDVGQRLKWGAAGVMRPTRWDDWDRVLGTEIESCKDVALASEGGGLEVRSERIDTSDSVGFRLSAATHEEATTQVGGNRLAVLVRESRCVQVVLPPLPWPDAQATFRVVARPGKVGAVLDCTLAHERYGGFFAYLNSGRLGRAAELLKVAELALFEKYDNPLAAAAAGYVMLANEAESGEWFRWLENLSSSFAYLPDGPLLQARGLARSGDRDPELEHDLLFESYERGIPFYSAGVNWLIEGLHRSAAHCGVCERVLAQVRRVALRMDLSGAYPIIRVALPSGRPRVPA